MSNLRFETFGGQSLTVKPPDRQMNLISQLNRFQIELVVNCVIKKAVLQAKARLVLLGVLMSH